MNIKTKINQIVKEYNMIANKQTPAMDIILEKMNFLISQYNNLPPETKKIITIPNIFKKTYDENFISDFLAYVLNPNINGFGITPIKSLLLFCGIDLPLMDTYKTKDVDVIREYVFQDRGRIDILILLKPDILIAIENKIFSNEGKNQTLSYEHSITHEFPNYNHVFIYLTPVKNIPPSSSNFIHISYNDIDKILKNVSLETALNSRFGFLFNEFILHIEEYIMKNKSFELSEKSLLFIKNSEILQDINDSFVNDSNNIFNFISDLIQSTYLEYENDWIFTFNKSRNYQFFQKKSWLATKDLFIHFEFWFSSESLFLNDTISFMFDVEGKRNDQFFNKFDSIYNKIKDDYSKNKIQYRPSHRKVALAYKDYKFKLTTDNLNPESIKGMFLEIYKEFEFLIPFIDETVAKM
jgi:hypothetical protein